MELTVPEWYDVQLNLARDRRFDKLWHRIGLAISSLRYTETARVTVDKEERAEVERVLALVRKARPR